MKNKRGITLIALIITIIVLLILAGISIGLLVGDNSILTKAKKSKEDYKLAEAREKLELVLVDAGGEKYLNSSYNENTFLDEFILESFKNDKETTCKIDADVAIVDGYAFELDRTVPKVGKYLGMETDTLITRLIANPSISNGKATVSVKVGLRNKSENDNVVFLYKLEDASKYIEYKRGNDLTADITDLTIGKKYDIQVQIISDSGKIKATKNKRVLAGILVEKIFLDESTLNLEIGNSKILKVTSILPKDATMTDVVWKSSDTNIVTVDNNGKVVAVAGGKATITAEAVDGGGACVSCMVTVELPPISFKINISDVGVGGWSQSASSIDGQDITKYKLTYYISTDEPSSGSDTSDVSINNNSVTGKNQKTNYFVWAVASGGKKNYASSNYYSVTTR